MELYFATSNKNKFAEAASILIKRGIELKHFPFDYCEIRSDSLKEIALDAVRVAYSRIRKPVFVEDTGLFIKALNGFPGTYSGWVLKKIGVSGILDLMRSKKEREAEFRALIAYSDGKIEKLFLGVCKGRLSTKPKGKSGFGYDPIFIPNSQNNSQNKTFAESIRLKNALSHRYKALAALANYLSSKL